MDKSDVFDALRDKLQQELQAAVGASKEAADYATNEEARAESKYDTQGLEASYLAAGQAAQAQELARAINTMDALKEELVTIREVILRGALVHCQMGRTKEWFYLCSVGGGETLQINESEITVITAHSPVGAALLGKKAGADFKLPNGSAGTILTVC